MPPVSVCSQPGYLPGWMAWAITALGLAACGFAQTPPTDAPPWAVTLRSRHAVVEPRPHVVLAFQSQFWSPAKTAFIVCDVWDSHHSINAVRRVQELAPRIDQVLRLARSQGATIIHAPSDCMSSYQEHPARKRAESVPVASQIPRGMESWCHKIDRESAAEYPLDQSDGGEDDDLAEHAAWAESLQSQGRNPRSPWLQQHPQIAIDADRDYITDRGPEVWSILEAKEIDQVVLLGVHTNMCVLGRPFGLRNLAAAGKQVVLMRDLTDTMYNPARWPYVNHHTGTDLIVAYIEQCVCPTIGSEQLLGGAPFRFRSDQRPRLALVIAEDEYETETTLPRFAATYWGRDFAVETFFSSPDDPNSIPGLEWLDRADLALISVRRRPLPAEQLEVVRRFAASNKPMLGLRTASHAFALRDATPREGLVSWPQFDAEVWGGNYTGHHGSNDLPAIESIPGQKAHPLLQGVAFSSRNAGGSLYQVSPLRPGTSPLLRGSIPGAAAEPVAWTFMRPSGGRSFYTSLGHPRDFQDPEFIRLLYNSAYWGAGETIRDLPERTRESARE